MKTSWQVVRHTEELVELERLGKMLEVERPDDPRAQLFLVQLRVRRVHRRRYRPAADGQKLTERRTHGRAMECKSE